MGVNSSFSLDACQQEVLRSSLPILSIPGRRCRLAHEDVAQRDLNGAPLFPNGTLDVIPLCPVKPITCTHLEFTIGKSIMFVVTELLDALLHANFTERLRADWDELSRLDVAYRLARIGVPLIRSSIPSNVPHTALAELRASELYHISDAVQNRLEALRIELLDAVQRVLSLVDSSACDE